MHITYSIELHISPAATPPPPIPCTLLPPSPQLCSALQSPLAPLARRVANK